VASIESAYADYDEKRTFHIAFWVRRERVPAKPAYFLQS
jgi:hypothetical protein